MFPANVWIYGPGRAGDLVAELRSSSPTSQRGELRAAMERQICAAGIRYAIVRLPEFYGPSVTRRRRACSAAPWAIGARSGRDRSTPAIELVYMPDAARALVEVATAADCDAAVFNLPGAQTTPRQFVEIVYRAAGRKPRVFAVSRWLLVSRERARCELRGVTDISHVWSQPILLDGTNTRTRFGAIPLTPLADAIATTIAWHRAHPELRLNA